MLRVLFVTYVFILVTGCTVVGEVDPAKDISLTHTGKALLKTDSEYNNKVLVGFDQRINITGLDGKSLYRMGLFTDYPTALIIEPGKHEIEVKFKVTPLYAFSKLSFFAEKEETYIIRKEMDEGLGVGKPIRFWIENAKTNEIVGQQIVDVNK
ncbi:hypothetical protein ACG1BZ_13780 [Microbulbifer sp. CNSA002]|uniref:hypothetical protein n=1 Tax=unclassified Microbulbifer TaxID=2619833 RepID=UPI0039B532A7